MQEFPDIWPRCHFAWELVLEDMRSPAGPHTCADAQVSKANAPGAWSTELCADFLPTKKKDQEGTWATS